MYAVIRIRGPSTVRDSVEDTMNMLNLTRANHCSIVPEDTTHKGMLNKASGFVTWGEINKETLEDLVEKRGRLPGDKRLEKAKAKSFSEKIMKGEKTEIKKIFRLSPPSKGFRATRIGYPKGDLGYRGEKINDLLKRMI